MFEDIDAGEDWRKIGRGLANAQINELKKRLY